MSRRGDRRVRLLGLLVALVLALPLTPSSAHAATITATLVVSDSDFPAAFTFDSSGRIFYGERFSGAIRLFNPTTSSNTLFFSIPDVASDTEQGLLGVALHPNYPTTPSVYAYVIRFVSGVPRNQIVRITDSAGTGSNMTVIFDGGPATPTHVGGRLQFGPDNMLYLVIGDKRSPARAQDLRKNAGKVLRMTATGGVPSDNPFSRRLAFVYGIRNSYGFGFDPQTNLMWETENGPSCNDELNRIARGRNYAWGPSQTCSTPPAPPRNTNQDGPNRVYPRAFYGSVFAPTGLVFCSSCGLGTDAEGRLFFGAWNTGQIRQVTLDSTRKSVSSQAVVFDQTQGILSMERGTDGSLYFSDPDGIYKLEVP